MQVQSTLAQGHDGAQVVRVVLSDITERKHSEQALAQNERRLQTIRTRRSTASGWWIRRGGCWTSTMPIAPCPATAGKSSCGCGFRTWRPTRRNRSSPFTSHVSQPRARTVSRPATAARMDASSTLTSVRITWARMAGRFSVSAVTSPSASGARRRCGESEARYRAVFEHAPVGIFKSTGDDQVLFVNPAYVWIFGYDSPEKLVSYANEVGVARAIHWDPDERPRLVEQVVHSGDWQQFEAHYRRRNGSEMV